MRHLIAKDLRMLAPYAWLIVPAHALWCVQAFLSPELYFWLSLAPALAWTAAVLTIEWQLDTDRLIGSLPVSRATVVKARYASAVGGLAIGAALYVAYGHLVAAIAPARVLERWSGTPGWASVDGVLTFVLVGYLLVIGFLPFHFRIGLPMGAGLFTASAALASFVAVGLVRLAGPTGPLAEASLQTTARHGWSEIMRGWTAQLFASWGFWPAAVALFVGAAVLGFLSVRLSVAFYKGREL